MDKQLNLPLALQTIRGPQLLEDWEIRVCKRWHEALRMQFNKARTRKNQEFWGKMFGYTKGIWNRILNGDQYEETGDHNWKRHFDPEQIPELLSQTGNMAVIQWLIKDTKFKLVLKTADDIEGERLREDYERELLAVDQRKRELEEKLRAA